MRYLATVKYNGNKVFRLAKTTRCSDDTGSIETVISKLLDKETVIYGSGRTDAGVHALGQTFHFDTEKEIADLENFAMR
jgi:tRNA pseudouridine38-40 synthase